MTNSPSIPSSDRRNQAMECFKLLASILVLLVHAPFSGSLGTVVNVLARCAVPGFFAISGFFSYGRSSAVLKRRIRHIFLINLTGFGLVLVEADILGLRVISTDIPGPRGFMRKHGGVMVENSENGILKGMHMLHDGQVEKLTVDYAQYNREAVQEFESVLADC